MEACPNMESGRGGTLQSLNQSWYAVHVKFKHEFKVRNELGSKGIEVFLPSIDMKRNWTDRKKTVTFPLFPGYLFTRINRCSGERLAVLKTGGVFSFLGIAGELSEVPEEQIVSLKKMAASKDLGPYSYIKEGDRVRIGRGPLKGIEGFLVRKDNRDFFILSVDVLQQGAALKVEASEVEKV